MEDMEYIFRQLENQLNHHLSRGKSVLLLGPRQTGKSTLLSRIENDLYISLLLPSTRQRYEKNPSQLYGEVVQIKSDSKNKKKPLIILDEIQKVPILLDVIQELIDNKIAQFILTGSSARKLRKSPNVNLLPGRVINLRLDPLTYPETHNNNIKNLILYGSLPGIYTEKNKQNKNDDLMSYVETYLEEEIRAEAIVRNVGNFARFLEYAGLESGNVVSFRAISQEIGVSHTTISSYFEILEDCLIAERVDPITKSNTRNRLTKSSRYILFDLGVRRICAGEGIHLTEQRFGQLFEQFIGLELIRYTRTQRKLVSINFWRDPSGPEVDWVVTANNQYIPIEVKWTKAPTLKDARHLELFMQEYPQAKKSYIVCRAPNAIQLKKNITALPWQELHTLFDKLN